MDAKRILGVIRGLLLIGMLAYFAVSLAQGLLRERTIFDRPPSGFGQDPGVRVLLIERDSGERTRRALEVTTLQPCRLLCPDNSRAWQLDLPGATSISFEPDPTGGVSIYIPSLQQQPNWGGRDGRAQRVQLVPLDHDRADDGTAVHDIRLFEASDNKPVFAIGDRYYRGSLEVLARKGRWLYAVNALPLEAYVEGVLQWEMGNDWPQQALMAQAIVARSFAFARKLERQKHDDALLRYDLTDTKPDPEYRGTGHGSKLIDWAIIDTRGQILTVRRAPFVPHFHASSGGRTAAIAALDPDATAVDGTPLGPVMPSLADPYCQSGVAMLGKEDTHWRRVLRFNRGELGRKLKAHGITKYWVIRDIEVTRHPSGHIRTVILHTFRTTEPVVLSAEEFRRLLGSSELRSTLWSADSPRDVPGDQGQPLEFEIETLGWGHGVGMSQVSAYAMAKQGWSAYEILRFFYLDTGIGVRW